MPKRSVLPETAVRISTYAELDQYVKGFVEHFNLLILIGRPGLQKSVSLRNVVGQNTCWLEGNVTPFRLYCKLYEHRNELVAIDDVDSLYADKAGVRLLKCVCQTEWRKTVAWHSASAALEKSGIPQEFTTTSRVAIIANDWRTLNDNVLAVEDRGHVVVFEPDPVEVHRRTAHWFWDQEIFDFLGARLHLIGQPSMRHYVKASELKAADMDWRGGGTCWAGFSRDRRDWSQRSGLIRAISANRSEWRRSRPWGEARGRRISITQPVSRSPSPHHKLS